MIGGKDIKQSKDFAYFLNQVYRMNIQDHIAAMDDSRVLRLFRDFSQHVLNTTQLDFQELHDRFPPEIAHLPEIQKLTQVEPLELLTPVAHQEAVQVARATLMAWSADPAGSGLLAQYVSSYINKELSAGAVIEVVTPILMTLIITSFKAEVKSDGTWSFSYDSKNINENAIKLVKTILGAFPESLGKLLK